MGGPTALKRAIFDSGETQRDLARRLGIDETVLSKFVTGDRTPSDATRQSIADALDVEVSELWPETGEQAA